MRLAFVLAVAIVGQFHVSRGFVVTRGEATAKQPDRILFFTMANCPPCERCKRETLPELTRRGLRVGHEITNDIQTLHASTNPAWVAAYKVEAFPTWIKIKDGLIVGSKTGYMTADEVANWR